MDILGKAVLDYFYGNYTDDIYWESTISEEDVIPISYLFRSYAEMPPIEQKALDLTEGRVLDIGCGAGCHSLYLQEKGHLVDAIDLSKGAIEVCQLRGIKNAKKIDLLDLKDEKYDTILLLMNGTGIFQKLEKIDHYLKKIKSLLLKDGQILIDSSDLLYMYDTETTEQGEGVIVPSENYYGELKCTMRYKNNTGPSFYWLYLDEKIFENACLAAGFTFEIILRGDNFDYLARLTIAN